MENFDKLPEEKRRAILNAAFSCFGKDGYKKTAIREIAVEAEVSKAALFYYFGTKRDLYLHLFRIICDEILARTERGTEDFFECVAIATRITLEATKKYSGMYDFMFSLVREGDADLTDDLWKVNPDGINKWITELFSRVDRNRFRPEISDKDAYNLINWVKDGYLKTYAGHKDVGEMVAELERYYGILKKAVYKEEFQ